MACNEDEYRSKARARAQKNRCYRAPTGRARQAPTRLSNSAVFGCSCAIEHDVSVWPNAADNPAISTYQLRNCYIPIVMLRASARQPRAPDGVWPPYRSLWAATPPFSNSTARSQRSRRATRARAGASAQSSVPELRRRNFFRREYEGRTLREHLGLPRPANRLFQKRGL
jgi:hypothetical protein